MPGSNLLTIHSPIPQYSDFVDLNLLAKQRGSSGFRSGAATTGPNSGAGASALAIRSRMHVTENYDFSRLKNTTDGVIKDLENDRKYSAKESELIWQRYCNQ